MDEAGANMSSTELNRRARERYGPSEATVEERLAALCAARGIWRGRPFTGERYVRAFRSGDMNENLRRIGA